MRTGTGRPSTTRLTALALVSVVCALGLLAVAGDARARRDEGASGRTARSALARALGLPDLALSSDARWLRHPSQAEPAAAISDAPGALDVDPAGAWLGPPRRLLHEIGRATLGVRR